MKIGRCQVAVHKQRTAGADNVAVLVKAVKPIHSPVMAKRAVLIVSMRRSVQQLFEAAAIRGQPKIKGFDDV